MEIEELQELVKAKVAFLARKIFQDVFENTTIKCIYAQIINPGVYYNDETHGEFYIADLRYSTSVYKADYNSEEDDIPSFYDTTDYRNPEDPLEIGEKLSNRFHENQKLFNLLHGVYDTDFAIAISKDQVEYFGSRYY